MQIAASLYTDPRLEPPIDDSIWGWEVDHVYKDTTLVANRPQLQKLLAATAPTYLLVRRLDELGDSLPAVAETLATLEAAGTTVIATDQVYQTPAPGTANVQLPVVLAEVEMAHRQRRIRDRKSVV